MRPDSTPFHHEVAAFYRDHFQPIYRCLQRLTGNPELAADLAQEAFVRLSRRGSFPDAPEAWVVSVAMNLLRNDANTGKRHLRLLAARKDRLLPPAPASPEEGLASTEARRRVRSVLDSLSERDRRLLLLSAEGFSYRDMASILSLNESSVGTLLARARRSFKAAYEKTTDAS